MALILNVKEGRSFFIGDTEYVMDSIKGETRFVLMEKGFILKKFEVDDLARVQVTAGVYVSAAPSWRHDTGRVMIDAPNDIRILRDTLYKKGKK